MHELYGEVPNGNTVLFYAGEFGYFMSNFSAFEVYYNNRVWKTSEHAYQAAGFEVGSELYEQIYRATSAHKALKIAHANKDKKFFDWDDRKSSVMAIIVRAKFEQHQEIQRWLKETGDAWLIENAPKDAFWGRGPDWKGRNELGKIWMQIRMEHYGT